MIETNGDNAYLRVDGNIFYILLVLVRLLGRLSTPNGRYPFQLNLSNYNVDFGGAIDVIDKEQFIHIRILLHSLM